MASKSGNLTYFNSKAASYDLLGQRRPWRAVRAAEMKAISELIGPVSGLDLLELGCGTGFYSDQLRHAGARVFGIDHSPMMIAELFRKGMEGHCTDVQNLHLDRSFHRILAAGLVEFLQNENSLFSVAKAHIRSGGQLVVLAPRAGLVGYAYELAHSWMGCKAIARPLKDLEQAAINNGWRIEIARPAGPLAVAIRFREQKNGES
jgi:SAM-dependent methyltransferase